MRGIVAMFAINDTTLRKRVALRREAGIGSHPYPLSGPPLCADAGRTVPFPKRDDCDECPLTAAFVQGTPNTTGPLSH